MTQTEYAGRRKLYRSRDDRFIAGVCAGFANYFNLDTTLVRVIWFASIFAGGLGIFVYIVSIFLIEKNPELQIPQPRQEPRYDSSILWGGILIVIGLALLIHRLDIIPYFNFFHFSWEVIWGLAFILLGIFLVWPEREKAELSGGDSQRSNRKIYRSASDKKLRGVCAGLAEHLNTDPNIVRLLWVMLTFASFGFGVIAYLILAIVLDEKGKHYTDGSAFTSGGEAIR